MCDLDGERVDVWSQNKHQARVYHRCMACGETVAPGQRYSRVALLFDGCWEHWKHCLRCWAMYQMICKKWQDQGEHTIGVDPALSCGESWVDAFGDPPPEVAKLAFALPGEAI